MQVLSNFKKSAVVFISFFIIFFTSWTNAYAENNCSVNIYPQPTPGTNRYTVTLTNYSGSPIYYFINNFWMDGKPSGSPNNIKTLPDNYWEMFTGLGYSVKGLAGKPILSGESFSYEVNLTFNSSFDGIDMGAAGQNSDTLNICSQSHEKYTVTNDSLNSIPTPTPAPSPIPIPITPENCSLNIYPQPTPGTNRYTVTLTNNTSVPGYKFINNYWVDSNPSGNPSNTSTTSDWYVNSPSLIPYQVTGTVGTPIGQNESITYEVNLTINNRFNGIDLALTSLYQAFPVCSQAHGTYSITYDNLGDLPTHLLDVPYFSQNAEPWGLDEYDHAISQGVINPYFERWGCAVTSAAMILNYHKMTEFPDGTAINPGSLNKWLENNKGYSTRIDKFGKPYSVINWGSIGTLTQKLYEKNKASYKLVAKPFADNSSFEEDMKIKERAGVSTGAPPIVKVSNAKTEGHYVVPKGISNNTIAINDPEWNYEDLTSFNNNSYTDYHSFTPSLTDFSSLYFVVNENIEMSVTDQNENTTGVNSQSIISTISNEIPNAVYVFEGPISNPYESGITESLGFGANIFSLNFPEDGIYKIKISSDEKSFYTLNLSTFQVNGNQQLKTFTGNVNPSFSKEYIVDYKRNSESIIQEIVTINTLISDLYTLNDLGEFKNKGIFNSLLKKAENSEKAKNNKTKFNILNAFLNELETQRGKGISENAYIVLNKDINSLLSN